MKFSQLRALQEIARAGSIQGAARTLAVSQPALSKAVRALEMEIGAELLERNARGVSLTACGQIVLKRSQVIQKEMNRLQEEISWLKNEMGGSLSIGLTPLAVGPDVASAVASLRTESPAIDIRLFELRPHQILEGLKDGSLDIGLVTSFGSLEIEGFQCLPMKHFVTRLVAGGTRSQEPVSVEDLLADQWIDTDVTGSQSYISTLVSGLGLARPEKIMRCTSVYLSVDLAIRLHAVFYMAEIALPMFATAIADGLLTPLNIKSDMPFMHILLVYKDEELLSPSARKFAKLLRMAAG